MYNIQNNTFLNTKPGDLWILFVTSMFMLYMAVDMSNIEMSIVFSTIGIVVVLGMTMLEVKMIDAQL